MQKNLLIKSGIIVATLLVFLYGIFGIPKSLSMAGLKAAMLEHIRLGLDLQGGMHLILEVQTSEAVNNETDHAAETLREELQKQSIAVADIARPDPKNEPGRLVIKGAPIDASSKISGIVSDHLPNFTISSGPDNSYNVVMKPQAEADLRDRTVEQSKEAITTRVDSLGVSEPLIARNGLGGADQIMVQLPGVDDLGRVKAIIQATGRLEFRQGFGDFDSEQAAMAAQPGGILSPNTVMAHGNPGSEDRRDRVYIIGRVPVVGGTDVRTAEAGTDEQGRPAVIFHLTTAAGDKFATFTGAHNESSSDPNHFLAIVLEGQVREYASIKTLIRDTGTISGGFDEQKAKDVSMLIRSGSLPASLRYLTERSIGPSLGQDSIKAGMNAAIAGMAAVLIFMLIYYRGAGVNANLALVLNLIILLGFMGFFGGVLTLPGIAGVILTVGMGVDSNVLIFERIREEMRNGKAPAAAVDQGFSRAWTTILDTHVTTIVSAIILFFVGTGPVSGFGLTLIFGLLANLFTAVFVSRVIFDAVLSRKGRGEALSI